jgi:hypothetical protein
MARRRDAPSPLHPFPTAPSLLRYFVPSCLRAFVPSYLRTFVPSYLRAPKYPRHQPAIFPVATLHPHPIRAKARPVNESPAFTLV